MVWYVPLKYNKFYEQEISTLINLFSSLTVDGSGLASATVFVYVELSLGLSAYMYCTPVITRGECKKCLQTSLNRVEMNGIRLRTIVQASCRLAYFYVDFSSGNT